MQPERQLKQNRGNYETSAISAGTTRKVQCTLPSTLKVDMKHEEEISAMLWKRYYDDVQELLRKGTALRVADCAQ